MLNIIKKQPFKSFFTYIFKKNKRNHFAQLILPDIGFRSHVYRITRYLLFMGQFLACFIVSGTFKSQKLNPLHCSLMLFIVVLEVHHVCR